MMEMQLPAEEKKQFDRFCRQYVQLHLALDYPDEAHLRNEAFQECLYKTLFAEDALKYAPPTTYRLRVLKELTQRIEQSIEDWDAEGISDDLMSCLSSLYASPLPSDATAAQQKSYVTYKVAALNPKSKHQEGDNHNAETPIAALEAPVPTVTLLESHSLVAAGGTTGHRTWEAALHLGNYLASNPLVVAQKSVLELGAGTGYLSVLCSRYLSASHVLSTDGSTDVVSSLSTNFYLNDLQDSARIEGRELFWGQALVGSEHPEWNLGRKLDLVIGADVTYDPSGIPALVATFSDLFQLHADIKIIISATLRNESTFDKFVDICEKRKFKVEEIKFPTLGRWQQEGPFYELRAPIKLVLISKL